MSTENPFFEQLKNAVINPFVQTTVTRTRDSHRVAPETEKRVLRIMGDGAVFPSTGLTEELNLEYGPEDANGLDIFTSNEWPQWRKENGNFIFAGLLRKKNPKVTLFNTMRGEEGSVLTQGSKRPKVLDAFVEMFNIEGDIKYIEVELMETPENIHETAYYITKSLARGDNAGKPQVVRREFEKLFVINLLNVEINKKPTDETLENLEN